MKKILLLTVIAVFVMMPFASFAKTAITDSELGAVTAQTGVTIDFTAFDLGTITIDTVSWGDADGFGTTYTGEGWVGASVDISTNAIKITDKMDIDVGTNGSVTAVGIKLPTINVVGNVDLVVKLDALKTLSSANAGTLGAVHMSGININPTGTLVIYAH